MKGVIAVIDSHPRIERTITFYPGESTICLEHGGTWELIPDPEYIKLSQSSYIIDTSVPNFVDLSPSFIALSG